MTNQHQGQRDDFMVPRHDVNGCMQIKEMVFFFFFWNGGVGGGAGFLFCATCKQSRLSLSQFTCTNMNGCLHPSPHHTCCCRSCCCWWWFFFNEPSTVNDFTSCLSSISPCSGGGRLLPTSHAATTASSSRYSTAVSRAVASAATRQCGANSAQKFPVLLRTHVPRTSLKSKIFLMSSTCFFHEPSLHSPLSFAISPRGGGGGEELRLSQPEPPENRKKKWTSDEREGCCVCV